MCPSGLASCLAVQPDHISARWYTLVGGKPDKCRKWWRQEGDWDGKVIHQRLFAQWLHAGLIQASQFVIVVACKMSSCPSRFHLHDAAKH